MSFEHPNRNNESMIDVERDIMSRPSERNTTNLDLQRMKMILDIMGHPEQSFRVIHITGTNGKGSTARMAEAICRAYGMRTAYTPRPIWNTSTNASPSTASSCQTTISSTHGTRSRTSSPSWT